MMRVKINNFNSISIAHLKHTGFWFGSNPCGREKKFPLLFFSCDLMIELINDYAKWTIRELILVSKRLKNLIAGYKKLLKKIWMFLSVFQMVFDKFASILSRFGLLDFRSTQNPAHSKLAIPNVGTSRF